MNRAAQAGPAAWFIHAGGKVWGPYPDARMAAFVQEGRVARETLVGFGPEGPFAPAGSQARLHRLFDPAPAPAPLRAPTPAPAPSSAEREAPRPHPVEVETTPARSLLVWASPKASRSDHLEALVAAQGPYVRIQPGMWLVKARMSPAGLRNLLTRRLEPTESLLVVAAPLDQAAWFNIQGDIDRALRQLWSGE